MVMRDSVTGRFMSSDRTLPREFPRDHPANENEPLPSVGPNVPEGFGDTHVMYPEGAIVPEPWQGWPVTWATQWSNGPLVGGNAKSWLTRLDIVFSCLDRNAGPLSTMPLVVQKDGRSLGENYRSWQTNPEPLAYASWPEFMKQLTWLFQAAGEVFLVCTARYADGYPQRFVVVEPWLVDVDRVGGRISYSINQQMVPSEDVLHLKYLSFPSDLRGHGPREAAGARMLVAESLAQYAADLASNGGAPWAVLKATRSLTAEQAQRLQAQWISSRMRAGGAPAVLDAETDIEVLSGNPRDMMLDELARFSEARIAVLLGVPPHLVGLPSGGDSLTYNTVAGMYDSHWRGTLRVMSETIMTALDGWLLPSGTHVEVNANEYIQPGWLERAQTYEILVRIGAVTPGQVAQRERWLLPFGDPPVGPARERAAALGTAPPVQPTPVTPTSPLNPAEVTP